MTEQPGRIYLVVGSPAVGKTSTTERLAARFERSVAISVDRLRGMVVSGYVWPDEAWSPEVDRQVKLARSTAKHMATSYADAGFTVVVDDFWDPFDLADYDDLRARPDTVAVLLLPTQEEAQRRNTARGGADAAYIRWAIGHVYGLIAPRLATLPDDGWLVLDTSSMDADSTVEAILEQSARGRRPRPELDASGRSG